MCGLWSNLHLLPIVIHDSFLFSFFYIFKLFITYAKPRVERLTKRLILFK